MLLFFQFAKDEALPKNELNSFANSLELLKPLGSPKSRDKHKGGVSSHFKVKPQETSVCIIFFKVELSWTIMKIEVIWIVV